MKFSKIYIYKNIFIKKIPAPDKLTTVATVPEILTKVEDVTICLVCVCMFVCIYAMDIMDIMDVMPCHVIGDGWIGWDGGMDWVYPKNS